MKSRAIIAALLVLAACGAPQAEPAANVQDVAANEMLPDEVTEVADDSATADPDEGSPANGHAAN